MPRPLLRSVLSSADHARDFGQHDGDRDVVGRFRDARGGIAAGRLGGEPDQLPRRREPAHHQHQRIDEHVRMRLQLGIELRLDVFQRRAAQRLDVARQLRAQHGERVARLQDADQGLDVFERPRRAELTVDPPPRLVVACGDGEHDPATSSSALSWKAAREVLGLVGVAGEQRCFDLLGKCLGLVRHHRVAEPQPDRLERRTRDAAAMLVIGDVVDEERLERIERTAAHGRRCAATVERLSCMLRRNSARMSSAPAMSSPRSMLRSSSAISKARAPGFSSRRNSRKRSTAG